MVKILSQAGNSLADTYDVEGSIAGIDHLETHELPIVHEMGSTVFSERFSTAIRRATSGAVAQNISWDVILTDLPGVPTRLLGVLVFANNAGRVLRASCQVRNDGEGRELPVWIYDGANFIVTRMEDNGGGVGLLEILMGNIQAIQMPNFTGGNGQPQIADQLAFRGTSTGFGAGTVTVTALYYIAFSETGRVPSSRGLPIPSW